MDDEQYVRGAWSLVHRCDGSYRHYSRGTILVQEVHGEWNDFHSWAAAAAFTREREQQIREVQEEIEWLTRESTIPVQQQELYRRRGWLFSKPLLADKAIAKRILVARQEFLETIMRGLKAPETKEGQ